MSGRTWTIGTGEDCDWPVIDEYASRHHATLTEREDGSLWIEDAGSTNGTYVNDARVLAPRPVVLGDRVKVGRTVLQI